jgi:hypothetical protein
MSSYTYNKVITHLGDLDSYLKLAISKVQGLNYNTTSNDIIVATSSELTEGEVTTLDGLIDSYTNPGTVKVEKDTLSYALNTEYSSSQEYSLVGNFIYEPSGTFIDSINVLPYSPVLNGTWSFKIYDSTHFSTIYESTGISDLDIQTLTSDITISDELSVLEVHVKTSSPLSKVKISYISISRFINE